MAEVGGDGLRLLNGEEEAGSVESGIGGGLDGCDTWSTCIG